MFGQFKGRAKKVFYIRLTTYFQNIIACYIFTFSNQAQDVKVPVNKHQQQLSTLF